MAPNAKVLSTNLISVLPIGARLVKVGYVDNTDAWNRIYLGPAIQEKFEATFARQLPSLKSDTDMVALHCIGYGGILCLSGLWQFFLLATSHEIDQVQRALEKEFRLNNLGTPPVSIHQHQYIQKVLSDFGMETCQTKSTPMNPKQVLNRCPDEEPPDEEAKARFATVIGSLMYLMVGTRPDIAFALGTLSRFTSQPQSHHQVALQRFLRNVKATQCHRITYRSGQLIGYTDADFGGSVVTDGAYSTSGYVFQLAGAPVSWSSKQQGEVATSTTHAEYIGQYNAILHPQWLRTFLTETNLYRSPITHIMADNQSAIALSRIP
ncbi:hypothetical protein N7456_006845 [Penicillium angulare]|uniref:Reverse transcriptase Ty1/copia-type domain-containing protein n=1 Tax=Penicillium angulare TaxID=116970 RepID=A0A9W9FID5_9EURO|nr:hypothetical protein N7456_006845 [Penicillium angulare]